MIIKAKHNLIIYNFFKLYTVVQLKINFQNISISGNLSDKGYPVIVLSNHVSWWDGFWVMYLNMKVFKRRFHFIMLEEQLRKNWFFMYTGGFSVRKGTKSIFETIEHAREIIQNGKNLLLVFPQGRIDSLYKQEFVFEKGIEKIVSGQEGKLHIVLNVNLVDYFSNKKPSLHIFYKEIESEKYCVKSIQEEYNNFHRFCRETMIMEGSMK